MMQQKDRVHQAVESKPAESRYVLITGGSSGIGLALAKQFAKDGYGIVLAASNKEKLFATRQEIEQLYGVPICVYAYDLAKQGAAEALYHAIKSDEIPIEVLVNNAGIGTIGATEQIAVSDDEALMILNMMTPVTLTKLFLRDMYRQKHGSILNVCSTGAFQPGPYTSTYYASKSFLLSYTKAVRYEAKAHGVKVCALCPGTTATDFFARVSTKLPKGAMSAEVVAAYGYKKFLKGKEVIIPGLSFRLMKLCPEKIKTAVIAFVKRPAL